MKCLIVLCFVTVNMFSQPNNRPARHENGSADHTCNSFTFQDNQKTEAHADTAKSSPPHWYAASEWWLVIIAALTGVAIWYQSRETAKATQAMRDNVAVLVKTQGPQVAAKGSGNHVRDLADPQEPRVKVALVNLGTTTAYDCTYESWIELLPFPFVDFTSEADYAPVIEKFAMYPHHEPVVLNIPIRKGLTKEERKDMFDLRKFVCFRVRIAYRDVFSKLPERYANFGFYAMKEGFGFLPKYNDSN